MFRARIWPVACSALLLAACARDDASASGNQGAPSAAPPEPSAGPHSQPSSSAVGLDRPRARDAPADPEGYTIMAVGGVAATPHGSAVVLTDDAHDVGVPIFIGGTEALSIALRLRDERYSRPLTHDLLDDAVVKLGGKVVSVRVDKLVDSVFYGTVLIRKTGRVLELDARPSDALALAVGNAAPIFVADEVIDQAGISLDRLDMRPPSELDELAKPRGVEL